MVISLKKNFLLTLLGNGVANVAVWLQIVVILKLGGNAETIGVFSVAQALCIPVAMLMSLKLQLVQVTDVRNRYQFGDYLGLRIITSIITVIMITAISAFYPRDIAIIAILLGVNYAIMNIRETFLSSIQKIELMDIICKSRIILGLLSLVMFAVSYYLSRSLFIGVLGLTVSRIAIFFYDLPNARQVLAGTKTTLFSAMRPLLDSEKLWKLTALSAPLGLVAFLTTLSTSIPRLYLEREHGRAAVGYFGAISSLIAVGTMISGALGQTVATRLASYFHDDIRAFTQLLTRLMAFGSVAGTGIVCVSYFFGGILLTLLFSKEFSDYAPAFNILAFGIAILFLFAFMNVALTATGSYRVQLPIYALATLVCYVVSIILIPSRGVNGAAEAVVAYYLVGFFGCTVYTARAVLLKHKSLA